MVDPTLFFVSDFRSKGGIVGRGVFDMPLGAKGVSRVAVGNIALVVQEALVTTEEKWEGKKIMVGSLRKYTDGEMADI